MRKVKLQIIKQEISKETLYKLAFKEACDMLVRTRWYKTNASAENSILTLVKKRYKIKER